MKHVRDIAAACQATAAIFLIGAVIASDRTDAATATVNVGTLTCLAGDGTAPIKVKTRVLECSFQRLAGTLGKEYYRGEIARYLPSATTRKARTVVVWQVLAPTSEVAAGSLAGEYVSVSMLASNAGYGATNVLIDAASSHDFALRPVTTGASDAFNVAGSVAQLKLTAVRIKAELKQS